MEYPFLTRYERSAPRGRRCPRGPQAGWYSGVVPTGGVRPNTNKPDGGDKPQSKKYVAQVFFCFFHGKYGVCFAVTVMNVASSFGARIGVFLGRFRRYLSSLIHLLTQVVEFVPVIFFSFLVFGITMFSHCFRISCRLTYVGCLGQVQRRKCRRYGAKPCVRQQV